MKKVEYYSADIAHQKSKDNFDNNTTVNLNKIFTNYITPAIDKGLFTVNVPYDLCNDRICLYLRETLGYELKYVQTGLLEYEYKISW